jgi:hypothetical protein
MMKLRSALKSGIKVHLQEQMKLRLIKENQTRIDFHDEETYALKEEKLTELEAFLRPAPVEKKIDYERVIKWIGTEKNKRIESELKDKVLPEIKQIPYFEQKKLAPKAWIELVKQLELVRFRAGSFVINIGELGESAFLILEGEVSILVNNEEKL